jgi:hypothetical protein
MRRLSGREGLLAQSLRDFDRIEASADKCARRRVMQFAVMGSAKWVECAGKTS